MLCSPYVRARETAQLLLEGARIAPDSLRLRVDERLREKEFGILDRLTRLGIRQKYPELGEQRAHVGKFYFRPPGGESWCDVILRLRSLLEMVTREYCARSACWSSATRSSSTACATSSNAWTKRRSWPSTSWATCPTAASLRTSTIPARDALVPDLVNFVAPLRQAGAPVTVAADAPAAPKP